MKATISQKIKIGVFTLIAFIVLFAGIFLIGDKKNMFGRTFIIYGTFKTVGGLQIGNNVRFGGINVGTVTSIDIVNDSLIQVGMILKEKVQRFLKDSALASIGSDGLMGDRLINISARPGGAPIKNGGRINTVAPVEFDKIITRFSHVVDNADAITSSLAGISNQINSGQGSLGRLIYNDSLERGLEGTIKSVHATVKTAHETIKTAQKGAEGFNENMNAMKNNILLKGYYKKKARKQAREERRAEQEEQQQKK